jgi:hypothetical protein
MGAVDDLSDSELRAEIRRIERLAVALSYRRRVLQGRLDILLAYGGAAPECANLAELSSVLAVNGHPDLPETTHGIVAGELEHLSHEERALSRSRRAAYAIVDILRAERVRRLRHASLD